MDWLVENWKELVGYLAPVFIILSMSRSNVKEIRLYMIAGCLTFVVYGALVGAWPVVVANALIGLVTGFYFLKDLRVSSMFSIINEREVGSKLIQKVTDAFGRDIRKIYPAFDDVALRRDTEVLFYFHQQEVVGMHCFRKKSDTQIEVLVDFVEKKYAGQKLDRYLFKNEEGIFSKLGMTEVHFTPATKGAKQHFLSLGFEEDGEILVKTI